MGIKPRNALTPDVTTLYDDTATDIPPNIGFMVDADGTLTRALRNDTAEVAIAVKAGVEYSGDIKSWTIGGSIAKLYVLRHTGAFE